MSSGKRSAIADGVTWIGACALREISSMYVSIAALMKAQAAGWRCRSGIVWLQARAMMPLVLFMF
jgi:hypothetical protein